MTGLLLDMAWKSSLVAAAGLALARFLRAHASDRVDILRLVFCALLLLPALSLWGPRLALEILPANGPGQANLGGPTEPADAVSGFNGGAVIAGVYVAGLLVVFGRCASGLWMLRRWTGAAIEVRAPEWTAALARIKANDARLKKLRLLVSEHVSAPLSWGARDPVVLIDQQTLLRPEQAGAVLAHEAAHVLRADWGVLMLMQAVAGLFWFNPLVWLLKRVAQQYAEETADLAATRAVSPASYAQVLLDCARRSGKAVPVANSIAPGPYRLLRRVRKVLECDADRNRRNAGGAGFALAAWVMFCLPVAALRAEPMSPPTLRSKPMSTAIPGADGPAPVAGVMREGPPIIARQDAQVVHVEPDQLDLSPDLSAEERAVPEEERRRREIEGRALAVRGRALAEEGRALAEQGRAYAEQGRVDAAWWGGSPPRQPDE